MMKHILAALKLAAALATVLSCDKTALATTELYFRPETGIVSFGNSHYKGSEAYGLSGACCFDDEGRHELSLGWSTTRLNYSDLPHAGIIGGSGTQVDGRLHTVLFGYRYHFGKRESRFRAFVGPLAGMVSHHSDASYFNDTAFGVWEGSVRKYGVALGAVGGLEIRLHQSTALQLGLRYLGMPDPGATRLVQMNGASTRDLEIGSITTLTLFMGLKFRL